VGLSPELDPTLPLGGPDVSAVRSLMSERTGQRRADRDTT
jgi:hypothetical protein